MPHLPENQNKLPTIDLGLKNIILPSQYLLGDAFSGLTSFTKSITSVMQGVSKSIELLQGDMFTKFFEDMRNTVNAVFPDLRKSILESISGFTLYHERERETLIESGWFICPSLSKIPFNYFRSAVAMPQGHRANKMTILMKGLYSANDWRNLGSTIDKWPESRFFTHNRMVIIRDALEAHRNKKYTLSIPALLPIIEGVCGDYCIEQKAGIGKSKSFQKAEKAIQSLGTKGEQYVSELVLEYISNQLYISSDKLKTSRNKKYLSRHSILHGSQTGYADCARSLRCFLLLDVLTLL
jgi:hypothetical protein